MTKIGFSVTLAAPISNGIQGEARFPADASTTHASLSLIA
jgi:hypothetical protein